MVSHIYLTLSNDGAIVFQVYQKIRDIWKRLDLSGNKLQPKFNAAIFFAPSAFFIIFKSKQLLKICEIFHISIGEFARFVLTLTQQQLPGSSHCIDQSVSQCKVSHWAT